MHTAGTARGFEVVPVACLSDNYAYLVTCRATGKTAVVDPSEAAPIEAALAARGLELSDVWCTHHHLDHVGGVPGLRLAYPKLRVYASSADVARIAGVTHALADGAEVALGAQQARVLAVPGHTLGAIAYHMEPVASAEPGALFTGDTLFIGGAGRMFEGTPAQFWASLARLRELPASTRVYCGHEYARSNYAFARALWADDGTHAARSAALDAATFELSTRPCSVPQTLARERALNPFLQCDSPALAAALGLAAGTPPEQVFAALRARKDAFKA